MQPRDSTGEIANHFLQELSERIPFDLGCLFLENEKDGHLHVEALLTEDAAFVTGKDRFTEWRISRALAAGGSTTKESWSTTRMDEHLREIGLAVWNWHEVEVDDGMLALVLLADRDANQRGERLGADADRVVREMGCMLHSIPYSRREERRIRQLRALLEVSRAVAETYEISVLLEKTLESVNRSFDTNLSHVLVFDEEEELSSIVLEIGGKLETLDTSIRNRLARRVEERGMEPLSRLLRDVAGGKLPKGPNPVISMPITVEGRTAGVIKCSLQEYMRVDEIDMEFLLSLANQLAVGIKNIGNYVGLQEKSKDLEVLNYIVHRLNGMASFEEVMEFLGETCREFFSAHEVFFGHDERGCVAWEPVPPGCGTPLLMGPVPAGHEEDGREGLCSSMTEDEKRTLGIAGEAVLIPVEQGEDRLGYLAMASAEGDKLDMPAVSRILNPLASYLYSALRRVEFYTEARMERAKLSAVFDAMRDAVIVVDEPGRYITVNREAERLFGIDKGEVSGMPLDGTLGVEELEEFIRGNVDGERVRQREILIPVEPPRYTRAHLTNVHNPDGEKVGKVAVLRDVTFEKRLENMKDDFLSCVSHELNTPLALIQLSAETLADNWPCLEHGIKVELLGGIGRDCRRLGEVVKDMLAVLSCSRDGIAMVKSREDLGRVTREVVEQSRSADVSHHYVLNLNGDDYTCLMDVAKMRRAIWYLLDNASKFSPHGTSVEVILKGDEDEVRLAVKDEGIGISQWHLSFIFDRFFQVDSSDSRQASGVGNGLFIAREIARRHGGDITVTSEPGEGSCFQVRIPRCSSCVSCEEGG